MGNHGVMIAAENIEVALDQSYYIERAAMIQHMAYATSKDVEMISKEVAKVTYDQFREGESYQAKGHLAAFMRKYNM